METIMIMCRNFLIFVLSIGLLGGGYFAYKSFKQMPEAVPQAVDLHDVLASQKNVEKISLPAQINLNVPFYPQAPFANWDYPWQEACEEASILLVANIYQNKKWTREQFNDEILKIVEWQKKRFGDYIHTDMQQTKDMLKEYLGLDSVIHENPSYDDIRAILAKGHLIVMPLDGKLLNNPYFTNGGPIYHVIVIKGYKSNNRLITHDVGTKRGADYVYSWDTISKAFHDYAIPMSAGGRRLIEVIPPEKTP